MKIWGFVAVAGAALFPCELRDRLSRTMRGRRRPAIGKAHALQGFPASRLDNVVEDCGRHSIAVDTDALHAGLAHGCARLLTRGAASRTGATANGRRFPARRISRSTTTMRPARRPDMKEADEDVSLSESSLERSRREVDDLESASPRARLHAGGSRGKARAALSANASAIAAPVRAICSSSAGGTCDRPNANAMRCLRM
ncbi:MAG: hypothetical protein HPM95_12830 [Alphaproteobacteria bacterium]|nr:hypothetical protein [Alphaproteobacteria bacterium]